MDHKWSSLLSLEQVAQIFQVSKLTIRRKFDPASPYYDENFPKPIRFGKCLRFLRADIENYLGEIVLSNKPPFIVNADYGNLQSMSGSV